MYSNTRANDLQTSRMVANSFSSIAAAMKSVRLRPWDQAFTGHAPEYPEEQAERETETRRAKVVRNTRTRAKTRLMLLYGRSCVAVATSLSTLCGIITTDDFFSLH